MAALGALVSACGPDNHQHQSLGKTTGIFTQFYDSDPFCILSGDNGLTMTVLFPFHPDKKLEDKDVLFLALEPTLHADEHVALRTGLQYGVGQTASALVDFERGHERVSPDLSGEVAMQAQEGRTNLVFPLWLHKVRVSFGVSGSRAVAMVQEGAGPDQNLQSVGTVTTWYTIDASAKVAPLAPPPVGVEALWPTGRPEAILGSTATIFQTLSADNTWAALPTAPAPPDFAVQTADGRLFLRTGSSAWVLVDGAWHRLTEALALPASAQLVLGPANDTAVRLIWLDSHALDVCTQLVDTTSFMPTGPGVCKSLGTPSPVPVLLGDMFNGTVDDFQVVLRVAATGDASVIWHFAQGQFHRGYTITANRMLTVFGASDAFMLTTPAPVAGQVFRLHGGRGAGTVYTPNGALFAGCVPPSCALGQGQSAVDSALGAAWYFNVNEADARRTVFVRREPVGPATCAPACGSNEFCSPTTATSGTCAPDLSLVGVDTDTPTTIKVQVKSGDGTSVIPFVTLAVNGGEASSVVPQVEGQAAVIEVPANALVELSLDRPGCAAEHFRFVTPNDGVQADLGTVFLGAGVEVGAAVGQVLPVRTADSLLVLTATDGGATVTQVGDASDGGLGVRSLFSVPSTAVLTASPDGGVLLVGAATSLTVVDLSTGAQHPLATSVVPGPWFAATFSRDGTSAAVERQTGFSVVQVGASPSERYAVAGSSVANAARLLQLSRDGSVALAHKTGGDVVASASGEVSIAGGYAAIALSGDGSRVYTNSTSVPGGTLSVQAVVTNATATVVASQVSAWAIDPDGADVMYSTLISGQQHQLWRYSAAGGTSEMLSVVTGVPRALTAAGAFWVSKSSSFSLWYPASVAVPRVLTGFEPASVDAWHVLQGGGGLTTHLISEENDAVIANGPGVFRGDASRRINSVGGVVTLDELVGNSVLRTRPVTTNASVSLATAFTATNPMPTLGMPCALYSVPLRSFSVDSKNGAVTWATVGDHVVCVK